MVDLNPYKEFVSSITPLEFEKYCLSILEGYAEKENLNNFTIYHNKKLKINDENYQIDIYAEFIAMSVKFKVIVECKRYSQKISREKISVLADKINRLGLQKGIFISTSGYQSGAIKYAKKYGITLIQIIDKGIMHIQNSLSVKLDYITKMRIGFMQRLPDYYAYILDETGFPMEKIYPSRSIEEKVRHELQGEYQL